MAVTNTVTLDAYAQIADFTYDESPITGPIAGANGSTYVEITNLALNVPWIDGPLGFQARAFFNTTTNELVIAFAGTEGLQTSNIDGTEFLADMVTNLTLAVTGTGPQVASAQAFIAQAQLAAAQAGHFNYDITYVGHSLGGFLAQAASAGGTEGEVVVFNSPGAGGFLGLPQDGAFPENRYTYVYSDPASWSLLDGAMHSLGDRLSDNIYVIQGAEGHAITNPTTGTGLSDVLDNNTVLLAADESIFIPVNEALQVLGLSQLLDFYDGEDNPTPTSDGIVTGTAGSDIINAAYTDSDGDMVTSGNDTLNGLGGNDFLTGGAGADVLNGGSGTDRVQYNTATSSVNVYLDGSGTNTGDAAGDTFSSIENLYGSNHGDILSGNSNANTIWGAAGNDRIIGGGGADAIYGGSGSDTASYETASAAVGLNLLSGAGSSGDAAGDTYVSIENVTSSNYADLIYGNNANNIIYGGGGNDRLRGNGGNDILKGGAGADDLHGGAGADTFLFAAGDGVDVITDFQDGSDIIQIGGGITFSDLSITTVTGGTLITYASGSSIELTGVAAASITQDDFVFV